QALVYRPEGGMIYFDTRSPSGLRDPASQVQLQALSSYPVVTNIPTADANGIYWGDAGMGVKLVYPDGSRDIFSLTVFGGIQNPSTTDGSYKSTAQALLTQKIDPQGRVINLGYERMPFTNFWSCNHNPQYYGFRIKYIVDADGRTNTFFYNGNA